MRDAFALRLAQIAATDSRVTFVTGDLGFGVFEAFAEEFPSQYLNVGVAEQNMIGVSTGLALTGRVVFAYSIGNFPVLRCLEQIRNDAAYHDANVKVVSIGGGFSYGPLGMSHHATEDLSIMRSIPAVTTLVPGTIEDVPAIVDAASKLQGTCYIRLDKSHGAEDRDAESFRLDRWRVMSPGDSVTLISAGGILGEIQRAAAVLNSQGLSTRVVNATQLAPLDHDEVFRCVGSARLVVTVEENVVRGGLGGLVAEALAGSSQCGRLVALGLHNSFVSDIGSQQYLRSASGLDAESIVHRVMLESTT